MLVLSLKDGVPVIKLLLGAPAVAGDQPFWANLNLGMDSRQLGGGSYGLGQIRTTQPGAVPPPRVMISENFIFIYPGRD